MIGIEGENELVVVIVVLCVYHVVAAIFSMLPSHFLIMECKVLKGCQEKREAKFLNVEHMSLEVAVQIVTSTSDLKLLISSYTTKK